ncbi:MAG TPA: hypothetical protein VHB79_26975 [Polyangiaceae bacterium]|nr:hypothetical protein [Polyangiaceae bacterium]
MTAAAVAAACGSSDNTVKRPEEGGAGGEAGAPAPTAGGSQSQAGKGAVSVGGEGGAATGDAGGVGQGGAPGGAAGDGGTPNDAPGGAASEGGAGGNAPTTQTVIDLGFDGSDTLPANLDPGTAILTPSQGYEPLGPDGNKFGSTFLRGPTGTVITLTLSELPPHSSLSLGMLFAAIDSLDGTGSFPAGDFFKITLDGNVVFRESFANATPDQIQSYDPPPAAVLARHVDLGFGGPGGYYTDSAYDFGQDPRFQNLPHTAASAVFVFTLEGEGVQTVDDESWAIDNVRVTANP